MKRLLFSETCHKNSTFLSTDYNIPVTRPSGLYNVYLLRYCTMHRDEVFHFYVRFTIATDVNQPDKKLINPISVQWL